FLGEWYCDCDRTLFQSRNISRHGTSAAIVGEGRSVHGRVTVGHPARGLRRRRQCSGLPCRVGSGYGVSATMKKIGLALSGGGFRASLYHLGLVRFLRDAGILSQVSHITSVSGGSVLAAHLVLNWDRYNGSANEFDAAAAEFLSFVSLDVRNRV